MTDDLTVGAAPVLADALADHPYDPEVAADLALRLFRALPGMYQVPDTPPQGRYELLRLLAVLGVPLATVRQSVQELHADLFVDTADDAMIPYLAQMVGATQVFPDADSNRRDVRGTVGWRRRKGTPRALEEMGAELTGQPVVLQEGWKLVQLAQDLNVLRPERTAVDLRPAVVAEQAEGPLDALAHALDVRAVGARTGRSHPRHVAHWMFPTITFPLQEATPHDRTQPGTDLRFAFDPLGARGTLRARRPSGDRRPFTDRIPQQHFAADPARWFGADGGFTVRVSGVDAAVAPADDPGRAASTRTAARSVTGGTVTISLLERPTRGWRGTVRVSVGLASLTTAGSTWRPTLGSFSVRAFADLDASGVVQTTSDVRARPRRHAGGGAPAVDGRRFRTVLPRCHLRHRRHGSGRAHRDSRLRPRPRGLPRGRPARTRASGAGAGGVVRRRGPRRQPLRTGRRLGSARPSRAGRRAATRRRTASSYLARAPRGPRRCPGPSRSWSTGPAPPAAGRSCCTAVGSSAARTRASPASRVRPGVR